MGNDGAAQTEQILGIRFFNGTPAEAVAQMLENGGLLVAPSGTCFERLLEDENYRRAVATADLALADSGLMVVLWRVLRRRQIPRVSGLAYLKQLLADRGLRQNERTLWILPNESARERLLIWSVKTGIPIAAADCYVAPIYGKAVHDEALVSLIATSRPQQIIIGIGAGPQEKLGWYLRENAGDAPAIHCIGGALGFVTGDQVVIPPWADRLYLGWFLRLLSQPRVMLPRLWKARVLPGLIVRYGEQLPPLRPTLRLSS